MSVDLHYFCFIYRSHPGHDESVDYCIRLMIFLIYAECAGWAALVWALVLLHRHRKHNGPIPALVIIVLLNIMLELLLHPYIITKLIQGDSDVSMTCRMLYSLWIGSVTCGVHLEQMMVLESFLALRHPSYSAHVFFPLCSIIFSIIVFLCFFLRAFFSPEFLIFTVIPLITMSIISWIVVCRTPPNEHSSNRTKKPDYTLLAYSTTTLVIYLIFVVLGFFRHFDIVVMFLCLLSLSVMVDPLLCVLVCKQKNTQSPVQTAVAGSSSPEY